jgi:glycerol-3-phosphate dehydrogenase
VKRDLDALTARSFDLLILGGGIAGATAAWDAAQRGLSVALVEAKDFGAGTSWNSLKTIHGGLRHLQRLDLSGLRESVRERRALLRIAPSLVRPLKFVVPAQGRGSRGRAALAVAQGIYAALSFDRNRGVPAERRLESGRLLSARDVAALFPGIGASAAHGGLLWEDAQVDRPEALLLGFLRAAVESGAVIANYVEADTLVREGDRVTGARVRDAIGGRELSVRADVVLAALGAGLDTLLAQSGLPRTGEPWLSAINVVVGRRPPGAAAIGGDAGGRHLFLVPWRDVTLIGTDYAAAASDGGDRVAELLEGAARAFPFFSCRREDVALVHRGFVPGAHAAALRTRDLVLDHATRGAAGLISATAAKYTTARALAERAVDQVLRRLGRPPIGSRTSDTPLPIPHDEALLEDRARRAARHEMAQHLDDVVLRRTDLGVAGPPAAIDLECVTRVLGQELGWDEARRAAERAALLARYEDPRTVK